MYPSRRGRSPSSLRTHVRLARKRRWSWLTNLGRWTISWFLALDCLLSHNTLSQTTPLQNSSHWTKFFSCWCTYVLSVFSLWNAGSRLNSALFMPVRNPPRTFQLRSITWEWVAGWALFTVCHSDINKFGHFRLLRSLVSRSWLPVYISSSLPWQDNGIIRANCEVSHQIGASLSASVVGVFQHGGSRSKNLVLITLLPFFYSWFNNWKDNLAKGLLQENSEEKDAYK